MNYKYWCVFSVLLYAGSLAASLAIRSEKSIDAIIIKKITAAIPSLKQYETSLALDKSSPYSLKSRCGARKLKLFSNFGVAPEEGSNYSQLFTQGIWVFEGREEFTVISAGAEEAVKALFVKELKKKQEILKERHQESRKKKRWYERAAPLLNIWHGLLLGIALSFNYNFVTSYLLSTKTS